MSSYFFFNFKISLIFIFYNCFIIDYFILIFKICYIFFFLLIFYYFKNSYYSFVRTEFTFIYMLAFYSLIFMVSSYNFISLFLSLELFSISVLVLISSFFTNKGIIKNSLKYFIVNAVASIFILLAITLFYGLFGTFSLKTISSLLLFSINDIPNKLLYFNTVLALFFFYLGLFIKLGLAPFHLWVFDVYENIPYHIFLFLLISSKFSFFFLIFYYTVYIFFSFNIFFKFFFSLISILTLLIISISSMSQMNIKKLLLSFSLFSGGTLIFSLIPLNFFAFSNFFHYLILDSFIFLCFLLYIGFLFNTNYKKYALSQKKFNLFTINDFYLISNYSKFYLLIFVLILSGLPPFFIFFLKFNILQSYLLENFSFFYIIFFLFSSMVISYNYLRIIKIAFFFNKDQLNIFNNYNWVPITYNFYINSSFLLFIFNFLFLFFIFYMFFFEYLNILIFYVFFY